MIFTWLGTLISTFGVLWGLLDIVNIFTNQYSVFLSTEFMTAENAGRAAREIGMIEDIGDALRLITFSVGLGILVEISRSVASKRDAD